MRIAEGGGIRVEAVEAGTLRVDGGAMFGTIPREVWERHAEPDGRNRILLAMRCLYIATPAARILVDTGAGEATPELEATYAIRNRGAPTRLHDSLGALGVGAGDLDVVVLTHLHFDHAGGATRRDGGPAVPSFPHARHMVQREEWEAASSGDRRLASAYRLDDLEPLRTHGLLDLVEGETELVTGVRLVPMPGHTRGHQGVLIEAGDVTVCAPSDLVPTAAHIPASWIMAYDVEPLVTWSEKERWLTRAGREGWRLVFAHDPSVAAARARPSASGVGCELEDPIAAEGVEDRGGGGPTPPHGGGPVSPATRTETETDGRR